MRVGQEEIAMGLDIRIPLGLMFLITGGLMTLYGLFTRGSAIYEKSLNMNINLVWGMLMFIFGLGMYIMGRRTRRLVASRVEEIERPLK
jgi:pilus assembly protein TadC